MAGVFFDVGSAGTVIVELGLHSGEQDALIGDANPAPREPDRGPLRHYVLASSMLPSNVVALLRLSSIAKDDWQAALQEILRLDSELLDVDRVSFWRVREEPTRIYCELGYVRSSGLFERGAVIGRSSPNYLEELRKLQLIDAADARQDRRTHDLGKYLETKDIGAILDMPVCTQGKIVGVLCHEHVGRPRVWTNQDQQVAVIIGQTLAGMLETHARSRSESAERRATFLSEVVPDLAEATGADEVAELAVRHALPMLGEVAGLATVEDGAFQYRAAAHVRAEGEALLNELRRRFPLKLDDPTLLSRTIRENQSLVVPLVDDAARAALFPNPEYGELIRLLRVRSAMAVPLVFRGQLSGGMVFCSEGRVYTSEDLRFAEAYARQIAGLLENARLCQKAHEAVRVRDEFLSLASHELRTPLTSLRAAAEVIVRESGAREDGAGRLPRMGAIIARQVEQLDLLSTRMLDASQIVGELPLRRERVDLAEITRDVVRSLTDSAKRGGSHLTIGLETSVVGEWDRMRIEQVVTNLLHNAIKFGAGRPIEVSTHLCNGSAQLSVRDHGIGISSEQVDRVFDRYYRGVSAQSFGGLGLGLYMVRRIVESHGGSVHVESRLEQGATFTVELPIAHDGACSSSSPSSSRSPSPADG